jgi:hypothetical protein
VTRRCADPEPPLPTFCRHNRLVQNCPICAREQDLELRPVVSSSEPRSGQARTIASPRAPRPRATTSARDRTGVGRTRPGVTVRKLIRGADDGYRSALVPGLKSGADAERLADELAYASARLEQLAVDPPGLYAEVGDASGELEERSWLAFLIAYLGPLEDDEPFAAIDRVRTAWSAGTAPAPAEVEPGPRGVAQAGRDTVTIDAYRGWAARAGSQAAGFTGEPAWTPERRFARVFERLALPGFHRGVRFDLLATLGRLGVYELRAGALGLGGSDGVTLAAKRLLGIGDPMLLERRASELAEACALPLEALDVGFYNWERGARARLGMPPSLEPDADALATTRAALGL